MKIHMKWLLLKKNKKRVSEAQKKREYVFREELDKLFDIAHANREFLIDQRVERKMIMTAIGKKLEKTKERSLKRKKELKN